MAAQPAGVFAAAALAAGGFGVGARSISSVGKSEEDAVFLVSDPRPSLWSSSWRLMAKASSR